MPITLTLKNLKNLKSAKVLSTPSEIADKLVELSEDKNNTVLIEEHDGRLSVMKSPLGSILPQPDFKMPDDDTLQQYAKAIDLPWEDEYASRVLPFWGSDERVDRHGDIVEQSWNFDNFKSNPVLLNQHNWEQPPIGQVLNWQVISRTDDDYTGPSLLLLCMFATAEQNPVADTQFRLAKAKILRTGSVGFYPGSMTWIQDPAERAEMGLGQYGYIYQNNELLEYSMATIPANAGAYQLMLAAKTAGLLRGYDLAVIRETKRQQLLKSGDPKSGAKWRTADIAYTMFWKCLFPEIKQEQSPDIEEPLDVLKLIKEGMDVPQKGKKPDDEPITPDNPTNEDDDISVMDALGAMTNMLTNVHDKLSDHSHQLETAHEKLDAINDKVNDVHGAVCDPTDEPTKPGKKPGKSALNPMELLLAAGSAE